MESLDVGVEVWKLRDAALRARRLASRLVQATDRLTLCIYADELDTRADTLERDLALADAPVAHLSRVMAQEGTRPPATLGEVLYAKSKPRVAEQDWAALVSAIAAGDQPALHALYERTHRIVFTLIVRITANRETAEELTIDVFHDVWRRAASYDPANGTVLGWIMNQARSRAIDRLRFGARKKRSPGDHLEPPTEPTADPIDVLELREQGRSLRTALAVLTPEERRAIETTFFAELTHAEAAVRLNQPLGTIKTRIRSGLHKLRQTLGPQPGAP